MSRTRRRVSRALIGALACTIALGLVFWLHNLTKTKAAPATLADTHQPPPPPVGVAPVIAKSATDAPGKPSGLVTQTPTALSKSATVTPAATPVAQPTGTALAQPAGPAANATTGAPSATPLVDARAKLNAGEFLAARNLLNGSLAAPGVSPADAAAIKLLLNETNQSVVFSPRRFPSDTVTGVYTVQPGDRLSRIATQFDVPWELLARINDNLQPSKLQAGKDIKIVHGPLHAVVDKGDFTLELWIGAPGESGSMYVTSFPVGLGRDDSTPTGTWIVETQKKIKNPTYFSPRGEGVIEADDPDNPLGEYWIGLTGIDGHAVGKQSYGIHGTIRPDSIGKQESMGCVRLVNENVAVVFDMLAEGKSTVTIRE